MEAAVEIYLSLFLFRDEALGCIRELAGVE
jgi:hypothetical protein